ncbi:malonate decarboxylase gamma subunit family protein, partial [Acinetobacter baumannii 541915]
MNIAVDTLKASTRGAHWFKALTQGFKTVEGFPASIWVADGQIDQQAVRVIAVVQDTNNLFPRAKQGEVGLLEGWSLAKVVDDVIQADAQAETKSAILCLVDVPSQA